MIKEAIEKIEEMAAPVYEEIDGRMYSSKSFVPVYKPMPETLSLLTLTGVRDFLYRNIDVIAPERLFIHVVGHVNVRIMSTADSGFLQRPVHAEATAMTPVIAFERRLSIESFIIQLQSMFVKTPERDNLLKFIGNLKAGFSKTMTDDGVSQSVTAKTGVTMVSEVEVPNPVTLQPYRTFAEIEQPASDFVFRIHGGEGEPTCALYEADGGAWKLTAIERIAEWIKTSLPDVAVIA